MHESPFIRALESRDLDLIRSVAKSDFHNHACLGYRLDILREFADQAIADPPDRFERFDLFIDYLSTQLHPHIYTIEGFEFSVDAALKQAIADGVTLLEISIDAQMMGVYRSVDDLILALQRIDAANPAVTFGAEVGVNRQWDAQTIDKWVVPMVESGFFVSIDLYGDELHGEPELFVDLYKRAGTQNMILKAHAGEYRDAEFVRHSVEALNLDEVQHGISAATSDEIMRWLVDRGTVLHICPTSNVYLNRVADIGSHPVRAIFNAGVSVTINSDDIMVFGKSVSEEYLLLIEAGVFSASELEQIRLFGLNLRG